ncbi:geraniol 8-hydroxylase-like isoform X2 [Punica granatum]|uniref:Geraniol 8-hydroxylase-like isoform X2 n=2 Tax=Punica granatum TaxID=22663 RepID=A0A218VY19_PUNGR|nr:geraniol 8-hydroxylase-like isoform X2 [Punica granatum]XP_031390324.1 geraniol 8-hydroxylase-like isoform X2 [Punica granatum]OWM64970.1 hypothetical protein CDL15_Pgr028688 [Punica granatum]
MESLEASSLISFCFLLLIFLLLRRPRRSGSGCGLPPGPRPLPVLGNILDLGTKPHRTLAEHARKHGPVMTLKLGTVTVVVVSSHEAAREVLQKNDHVMASRTIPDVVRARDHYKHSLVWLPNSAKWKGFRRACSMQLFSRQKLDVTEMLRQRKVDELLDYLHENSVRGKAVTVGQAVFTTVLNLISNTLFSIDLTHHKENSVVEFKELIWGMMKEGGSPNISDFFPALRWIDPQGARRRMDAHFSQLFAVFDRIVEERTLKRASTDGSPRSDDMLESLLDLRDSSELNREDINSILADLVVAGVDTTHTTVEWAMVELLRHAEKMAKARAEIEQVLGKDTKVQESDIPRLPYLRAVVKETFRLYSPFLLPHRAETEVDLCGFKIPKDTQIMVNLWAMGRDESVWQDPDRFEPERFLELKIDIKGTDFELIPFGAGRRMCPGMPLGYRMVHLILGSLIRSFDWKLANGEATETMDMNEKNGITIQKAKPLCAVPIQLRR